MLREKNSSKWMKMFMFGYKKVLFVIESKSSFNSKQIKIFCFVFTSWIVIQIQWRHPMYTNKCFFFFLLLQNSLIWCRYNAWAHGKYFWFRIFFQIVGFKYNASQKLENNEQFFLNTENESNRIKWCRRKNKINDVIGKWKKFFRACIKRDCMKACGSSKVHETPSHSLR